MTEQKKDWQIRLRRMCDKDGKIPIEKLGLSYSMGDAAYEGDWDRYWSLHKKYRQLYWTVPERIVFRIGALVAYLRGGKLKA